MCIRDNVTPYKLCKSEHGVQTLMLMTNVSECSIDLIAAKQLLTSKHVQYA